MKECSLEGSCFNEKMQNKQNSAKKLLFFDKMQLLKKKFKINSVGMRKDLLFIKDSLLQLGKQNGFASQDGTQQLQNDEEFVVEAARLMSLF